MMFFLAMTLIATPRATMKHRKAHHNPWLPKRGVNMCHAGMKMKMVDIIMVFLMALEAVAPMYMPSQMNAANVINGMIII